MEFTQFLAGALLAVLLVDTVYGLPKYFKDCGSKGSVIESASVSGCKETDETCRLKRGTTVDVAIGFKTSTGEVITNSTAVVHGIIGQHPPVRFPIPESDGCKSGLSCPVKQDTTVLYKSKINVLKIFPKLQVVVKWELKDQNTKEIFCAAFRAEIV